jgi:hypothetical protein
MAHSKTTKRSLPVCTPPSPRAAASRASKEPYRCSLAETRRDIIDFKYDLVGCRGLALFFQDRPGFVQGVPVDDKFRLGLFSLLPHGYILRVDDEQL